MPATPIIQNDMVSLKIPHHLVEKLNIIAEKEDRSRSSLIRNLIASYVEDYEDIRDALKARAEYKKEPEIAISHNELLKELNLNN